MIPTYKRFQLKAIQEITDSKEVVIIELPVTPKKTLNLNKEMLR